MKPKIKKLSNGLKVLQIPQKETKALTLLVLFPVGSRYEDKSVNGVSHFIEHLMFKGTNKRPTTLDISKELDGVGAEYNAFTGKEYTGYYIKVSSSKLKLGLDLLSDMLFNSKFDPKEIDRERGVILEEINMYEDNPLMYCEELCEQLTFDPKHSLGQLIIGPRKVIKTITREKILEYRDKFYDPSNMILGLAGNFDKKALSLIENYFDQDKKIKKKTGYPSFKRVQKKPQVDILYKKTEQIQACLSLPGYEYNHKNMPALNLLSIILGGNMSSRLFTEIRERRGLAYFVKTDLNIYQDTGLFMVQAGLDKTRLEEAITEILKQLKKVKSKGITPEELQKAKDYIKGKIDLSLEDSEEQASWYTTQYLLTKKLQTPAEKLAKINKVTPAQIQKIAQELFKTRYLNLALIGPLKDKNKFKKLLKI